MIEKTRSCPRQPLAFSVWIHPTLIKVKLSPVTFCAAVRDVELIMRLDPTAFDPHREAGFSAS